MVTSFIASDSSQILTAKDSKSWKKHMKEVFCYMVTIGAYDLSARDFTHNM